jgi:phosphatidate cytidylyltransferase
LAGVLGKGEVLLRILLGAVAFPVLLAAIFVLPQATHLAFNLIVTAFILGGALEAEALLRRKGLQTSRWFVPVLSASFPVLAYLEAAGIVPQDVMGLGTVCLLAVVLLSSGILHKAQSLPGLISQTASSFFVILYPAFFLSYMVRLSGLPAASWKILYFLCVVFFNDILAYFAGSLLGGGRSLGLPVSPNKTAVGFVFGFLASVAVSVLFALLLPEVFPVSLPVMAAFGGLMGLATIFGDLIESGLKRSADVKDSGNLMPGRGGVLDSIDSMVLTAPLCFYFFRILVV